MSSRWIPKLESPVAVGIAAGAGIVLAGGILYLIFGGSSSSASTGPTAQQLPPFTGGTSMPAATATTPSVPYTPTGPLPPGSPAQWYQDQINQWYQQLQAAGT